MMRRDELTEDDVTQARAAIIELINGQARSEPLLANDHTAPKEVAGLRR